MGERVCGGWDDRLEAGPTGERKRRKRRKRRRKRITGRRPVPPKKRGW
jgi:hypothetical protein